MEEASKPHRQMDASDLYRALENFFRDNQSHHRVENRWLAQQSIRLKTLAYDLGQNGVGSFQSKYAVELAEFRLIEIENERDKIAKADRKLTEEADRLKRQTKTAEASASIA